MRRIGGRQMPAWLVGSGVIALAMGVMNVATYGFTLVSARLLGPVEYGALAALMGVILVLNVVSLGLMATAARRVAADVGDRSRLEREVWQYSIRAAGVLAALILAATPALVPLLQLDSWVDSALMAVTVVPLTVMGAQSGLLQGERRWGALAAIYLGMGLGRFVVGLLVVAFWPDTTGAMVGVAAGAFVPAVIGWLALRRPSSAVVPAAAAPSRAAGEPVATTSFVREVMHNSHALLAFFTLSNTDVIVARTLLDGHAAGLYAGGLILAKAVLFLPQFVVVLVFPSMAGDSGGRPRAQLLGLGLVAPIGAAATLVAAAVPDLAVVFVGGTEYRELSPHIWAFAAVGTLLALLQLLVYGNVARQHRSAVWVTWASVLVLVVACAGWVDTLQGLVATVIAVLTVVVGVLVVIGARRAPEPPVAVPPTSVGNVG